LLVDPVGLSLSPESASDNAYMDVGGRIDVERARAQHRVLADALRRHAGIAVEVFAGDAATPDAVFPNNVYATTETTAIVGAMRHAARRRESRRTDIVESLARGRTLVRIDGDGVVSELTGPLVVDRARRIGYHGRTERLNDAGVVATHAAFGLALSFAFDLAPGEYHTNVVMSVLAGRALVVHEASFADPDVPRAIASVYGEHVVRLDDDEKAAFVGNCIALPRDTVWMGARAERALSYAHRRVFDRAGFTIHTVEIDEIEKAGGSLRCCVAELF
ncbi:MAG TPA: arginine deiminase-related protein, partial [Candidatus Saccharimonadia bacterium]|nr:arginine deiminase-related protein [Candidatus Saccharimonadia bacterium]